MNDSFGKIRKTLTWPTISVLGILVLLGSFVYIYSNNGERAPASEGSSFLPADYENQEACEKQNLLWDRILATQYGTLPPFRDLGILELSKMALQGVSPKLDHVSDVTPQGWVKYIHPVGSVAKISWEPVGNNPYSGLFQGAHCGLIRLSLTYKPDSKGVAPGAAIKILIKGRPSANFSALPSLESQDQNYNFFQHSFSNIVPASSNLGAKLVHQIFKHASNYPEKLFLEEWGHWNEQGEEQNPKNFPLQVFLIPDSQVRAFSENSHDVRSDFSTLSAGSVLFHVKAVPLKSEVDYEKYSESDKLRLLSEAEPIADIVLQSNFVSSTFGDSTLFFRHQRFFFK